MEQIYYIKGMHCASCEVVIEKKLLEINGIEFVDVSLAKAQVVIGYKNEKPRMENLNRMFKELGYKFSGTPFEKDSDFLKQLVGPIIAAGLIIIVFLSLGRLGLTSLITVDSGSSYPAFFVFGLIAGVSSCAALIGGLLLSLSKQWTEKYGKSPEPYILFNLGRLISYGLFGAVLGLIGKKLQITSSITSILILIVSFLMFVLAMQMLGVDFFNKFKLSLPKSITHRIADESKSEGKYTPLITGFFTFFLPCGFTIIAQGMAVLSGSATRGGLIMGMFALGTALPLLFIGISSAKMLSTNWSEKFIRTMALLILFFVGYNLTVQFNLSRYFNETVQVEQNQEAPDQIISTVYTSENDIVPSSFEVKKGETIRFEVDVQDNGSGCMSTIMIPGLYDTSQYLKKGETLIMEFTPTEVGEYQITCAMGVPRGTITVTN